MKWLINWTINAEKRIERVLKNEEGQAFSEYAIVIGIVAVVVIATIILFKNAIVGVFTRIITALNGV